MALGDGGVGIPARLKERGPDRSDAGRIELALEPQVSTRLGRGGMGLTELSDAVREHGTYMAIRSGQGHVIVDKNGKTRRDDCAPLPGTLVEVVW